MAVYFKFKSAKDFDSVSIDGHFISVANLKEKIVEQKKLGRGSDYDLVISNAQTNEEYTDEGFLVPKNTSVIVRRVPGRPSMPIVADVKDERKSAGEVLTVKSGFQTLEPTQKNTLLSTSPDGLDDFGVDLYAVPEVVQASTASLTEDEDSKIKAFVDASASDWQRQTQESFAAGRGYGNKGQGRGLPARGYGRGFEKKNPPHGYVCHRCGVTGHYIQHCPTNGDPTYDIKKVKPPTGIPKTMLVANPDGSYALPTGEVAVLKPNEAVFEREIDGLPSSSRPMLDIPPELCCPLCKGVLKEAVLTSKCCFKSYCDKCIRNEIITKARCVCGAKNILADDLLPNRTLRDAISRFLESQASAATSSGNVGSRVHLPDMESAPYVRPKMASPAVSASLKEASSVLVASDGSDTNEKFVGGKESSQIQAEGSTRHGSKIESASGKRPAKDGAPDTATQALEIVDGSPESQLTKDGAQEIVSSERPATESREQISLTAATTADQGPSEPVKGRKKPKNKRARQGDHSFVDMPYADGMWGQGPNYNPQSENCCMHCGSCEHPSWNCYMNGPGPSHPPSMQGPMFGPGFNPPMRGIMHQPMGDGYMMPYHHNPAPYNPYGFAPYDMHFNGPMVPPHEAFVPHAGMMPYGGPPIQRDYIDPNLMSRDEFEARKAELKRRKDREQRFGREQVKYPSTDVEMETGRLQGRVGHRIIPTREREGSPDVPDERGPRSRSFRNVESGRSAGAKVSRSREEWIDKDEFHPNSDEGSAGQDYHVGKSNEKLNSRQVDEASSGEEVSREGRYSRGEMEYLTKKRERGFTYNKVNGDATIDVARSARSGQRRTASGYDSEDDGDFRRLSGSQVGPSSPFKTGNAVLEEQFNRESVDKRKDSNGNHRQDAERYVKVGNSREGNQRGSVFDRTNLPIKPRRTRAIDEEYEKIDEREFRVKRSKGTGNRLSGGSGERVRDSEDGSRQHSSANASRKRRMAEDIM